MKFDRFMAIDFGEKRIGLAIGDSENLIASPLDTILNKNMETSCEKIYKLVKEWEINHIVIGLPRIFAEQSINKQIKNFGNKLKKKFDGTDIIFFDEDYSSNYAKSELLKQMQAGRKKKVNKEEIDILLRERVGILLTKRKAIITVKNGVRLFIFNLIIISDKS